MSDTVRTLSSGAVDSIVGCSAWACQIRSEILRVGGCSSSVLITGPTGTGKELIARAIHGQSPRAASLFIPVDCAAIQGSLFASQLFGYVKGAFTGATHRSLGCFRAADGGTLFLDEVGELETESQAKILRTIQEKMVVAVGAYEGVPVDVRIIAATNHNLADKVALGDGFREDLYYRLNVVSLRTVPLKDRPEDIPALADHFLKRLSIEAGLPLMRLSPHAIRLLAAYTWPGNVRQLQNLLERAVIYSEDELISARLLSELADFAPPVETTVASGDRLLPCRGEEPPPHASLAAEVDQVPVTSAIRPRVGLTLAELERERIVEALEETYYNQTLCARVLGIDRRQLARKIRKHGVCIPAPKRGRPARRKAA